jgi:hypothetical protein
MQLCGLTPTSSSDLRDLFDIVLAGSANDEHPTELDRQQ